MNEQGYKERCKRPDSFSRQELEDSFRILSRTTQAGAGLIKQALDGEPISKPTKHSGGPESDFFGISISSDDAEKIFDCFRELEQLNAETENPELRLYCKLGDKWFDYVEFIYAKEEEQNASSQSN